MKNSYAVGVKCSILGEGRNKNEKWVSIAGIGLYVSCEYLRVNSEKQDYIAARINPSGSGFSVRIKTAKGEVPLTLDDSLMVFSEDEESCGNRREREIIRQHI